MAAMACTPLGAVKVSSSRSARSAQLASSFHGQSGASCSQSAGWRSAAGVRTGARRAVVVCKAGDGQTVVIGLAADSGCGKSTFMRRLTSVFGGAGSPPKGGNPDSNTLISDTTTVICLDDYHSLDRFGRKEKAVTALDPRANDFDLMYEQVKALKEGKSVQKPIYNHVTGLLDAPETIAPPKILVIEGLHPM
jgi:phosphoribulokinase